MILAVAILRCCHLLIVTVNNHIHIRNIILDQHSTRGGTDTNNNNNNSGTSSHAL